MLWITVGVNRNIIDRILVHNTGNSDAHEEYYEYEILNAYTGDRLIEETIWHKRVSGYRPLLQKALTLLKKHKIPTTEMAEYYDKEKNKSIKCES